MQGLLKDLPLRPCKTQLLLRGLPLLSLAGQLLLQLQLLLRRRGLEK